MSSDKSYLSLNTISFRAIEPTADRATVQQQQWVAGSGGEDQDLQQQNQADQQLGRSQRQSGVDLIHNAQRSKTKQEDEGPVTVKYVDLSKTSDIYDKVREYQETGKKRYP
eukprot:gene4276-4530_t